MYRLREDLESIVDQTLSLYAVKNALTKGRSFSEPKHPYRLPFERDRERIIHSTAWRRLEYKTQVFVNHEGDHFRTRMTHSIEVSTIARVVCNALGLNTDLAEAIGLAHDLGHTPFGHSGEEVLNNLMSDKGGFEHNRQSLRVVQFLESRYPNFNGLNLSYETLEGIIKHASRYDKPEMDLFIDADTYPSFEAQVVNIADELAYTCHDFDDGIYSDLINLEDISNTIPLMAELIARVKTTYKNMDNHMLRKQVVRALINHVVTDCVKSSATSIEKYNPQSTLDAANAPVPLITISHELRSDLHKLGTYLYTNLYKHYKVIRMTQKTELVISRLFETFIKEPRQLPDRTQKRLENEELYAVVADYIAGMTDRYAMGEYRQLFDPYVKML